MRFYSLMVVAVMLNSWMGTAIAAENPQACAQAYEKAQEEKSGGRLLGAIAQLKTCIDPSCPAFIIEDCTRWMGQAESALPTVVFSVREDGKDLTKVEILCDKSPLTDSLDGKALSVDPGLHDFTFIIPGQVTLERQILVREAEHNRIISLEFNRPVEIIPLRAPPSSSVEAPSGVEANLRSGRYLPYAFAGVGALGVAGFTVFAILGSRQQGDLERSCAPNCQSGQVDSVKTKYHVADVSLGVGLVSLGVATYLWARSHGKEETERMTATAIEFVPRSAGGVLQLSTSY
jgi:hypothetical protein